MTLKTWNLVYDSVWKISVKGECKFMAISYWEKEKPAK